MSDKVDRGERPLLEPTDGEARPAGRDLPARTSPGPGAPRGSCRPGSGAETLTDFPQRWPSMTMNELRASSSANDDVRLHRLVLPVEDEQRDIDAVTRDVLDLEVAG